MTDDEQEASMSADIYALGKIMQLMLPELRYRSLIRKCLREDASARPSAAAVLKSLNGDRNATSIALGTLLAATLISGGIYLGVKDNSKEAMERVAGAPAQKIVTDTVYVHKTDTLMVEVPGLPSESAIKAVWDKTISEIEPQVKYFSTFDFPDPESHRGDIDMLAREWGNHLYYTLLGIGCTEETASAKRKELADYMHRRASRYRASKPAPAPDTIAPTQ